MPELPDITAYMAALEPRIVGQPLLRVRLASPFLLRTAEPPLSSVEGTSSASCGASASGSPRARQRSVARVALMIAGRLHWRPRDAKLAGRQNLAAFDFPEGSLVLTEAGAKRRASLQFVAGEEGLRALDPAGIDVLAADLGVSQR